MIFELMSKGTIVRLPDDRTGLPERKEVHVMLLLPFNRYIWERPASGERMNGCSETWERSDQRSVPL
jgi:hypothetical protein